MTLEEITDGVVEVVSNPRNSATDALAALTGVMVLTAKTIGMTRAQALDLVSNSWDYDDEERPS